MKLWTNWSFVLQTKKLESIQKIFYEFNFPLEHVIRTSKRFWSRGGRGFEQKSNSSLTFFFFFFSWKPFLEKLCWIDAIHSHSDVGKSFAKLKENYNKNDGNDANFAKISVFPIIVFSVWVCYQFDFSVLSFGKQSTVLGQNPINVTPIRNLMFLSKTKVDFSWKC